MTGPARCYRRMTGGIGEAADIGNPALKTRAMATVAETIMRSMLASVFDRPVPHVFAGVHIEDGLGVRIAATDYDGQGNKQGQKNYSYSAYL